MEKLLENISRYLEARIELLKIDAQQKVAGAIVTGIQVGAIAILVLFTVLFASVGLANYLNSVIGNSFAGYFIVAAFYLVLFLIIKVSHKAIQTKVEKMTDNMFSSTKEKEQAHANDEVEVVVDRAATDAELNGGFSKSNVNQ